MWWDVLIAAILLIGVAAFVRSVLWRSRTSVRRSNRTLEDIYPNYGDSLRDQQRYAERHGGTWRDDEPTSHPPDQMP